MDWSLEMSDITPLQRFRVLTLIQGASMLVMVFISIPMKHIWNIPQVVFAVGLINGELIIAYIPALVHVFFHDKWKISQGLFALITPFIPFAPFFLDVKLRRYPRSSLSFWGSLYLLTWIVVYLFLLTSTIGIVI